MAEHQCPLCGALMSSQFVPSTHPAIPDRTLLHCTNRACDWCGTMDDLPHVEWEKYQAPIRTARYVEAAVTR